MKDQNLQRKIQQLQSMLGEINRYLQGSASKPPGVVARLLEEKSRITSQLRELNNMHLGKPEESDGRPGNLSSVYNLAGKLEKGREYSQVEQQFHDPLDVRLEIEEILQEMGITTGIDSISKRILLSGTDVFIDNLISTACSAARNKNLEELTKEDILFAMRMERNTQLYNKSIISTHREPDKEHLKRLHIIQKDKKRCLGNE
ncbi:transcription initiation factor TFIID subunit 12 [Nematocida sp. AWRm78]|nr:transcription initiation factor TFIID subunit 12 [Nematocida sp. AWRm79]KAI5186114.1 transcription initiation factor TFIID subunit 12 [Nematocida sp. AWRm78]